MKRSKHWLVTPAVLVGALTALASQVAAQEGPTIDTGDTAWVLTSAALVLFMTAPGLALFYGGLVRRKNALATIMQSFILMCMIRSGGPRPAPRRAGWCRPRRDNSHGSTGSAC